ncbi:LacI family DNA-binding transcriptional regulator [Clostridium aquiflavi]|uniref:LacI family DNA-binding transcriptional regulator n=1 Tax=Clostridium aquiflavi TaxID=3073603 RepID=A0ABU1EIU5_9CLOT|nr:LacI family DNA-binding transcriptional regulator [Clostridium sp. 5N-1]MDR5588307.1 LacI family DNA-binding transcriptional regulator [Clostridium sp. 5N-1]
MNKKVTISEVAKAANVSVATVSRILNKKDGNIKISEKTKTKVLDIANSLGYQQNPFASALRTKNTGVLGVIVRDITDPLLSKIVKEVQNYVHEKNLELFIGHTNYQYETAKRQLNAMINYLFDGLIILDNLSENDLFIQNIKKQGVPFVAIMGDIENYITPVIRTDEKEGIKMALNHLITLNHENIGYIGNQLLGVRHRFNYFKEEIEALKLPSNPKTWQNKIKTKSMITDYLINIQQLSCPPTAIVCATDKLALQTISSAQQLGIKIPEDLSIIGFDDIEEASEYFPSLTTIHQSVSEISAAAIEQLISMIQNKSQEYIKEQIIQPKLIIRSSTSINNHKK